MNEVHGDLLSIAPVTCKVIYNGIFIGWMMRGPGSTWFGHVFGKNHMPAIKISPMKDTIELGRAMKEAWTNG